jgi:DNA-binding NtrC family response regulator
MLDQKTTTAYIVDDEPVISSTVAQILNMSGFHASAYLSSEEAIAAAEKGAPDLLVTDVCMSGMNAIDLAIRFKEMHSACKVLLYSGQSVSGQLLEEARENGHKFTFLMKPVHPRDLLAAIRKQSEPLSSPLVAS